MTIMQKLSGKNVLITGGNSGIGLAAAKLFLEQGARVAITGRDPQALDEAATALGHDVLALRSDAASVADIEALMSRIAQQWGRIDVLFVNAAIASPAPFELVSEAHFDSVMSVNLKGSFFAVQKALPLLKPGASVIFTTSIANQIGAPNFSVYAASKAAMRSMVQTLALELVGKGIRVNAVSPGPIATPIWGKFGLPAEVAQAAQQEVANKSPSKRFGEAEEVAKAALFLACDDSSYVVGQEVVVDGGMSLL